MNFKKTALLGSITAIMGFGLYYFEFVQKEKKQAETEQSQSVLQFKIEEINLVQIQHGDQFVVLQKTDKGWQLIEPIQDLADEAVILDFLKNAAEQKLQNIESEALKNLAEYGLDRPKAVFILKNNQGESKKIMIGSQKNFEGKSFGKINDDPQIKILQPFWDLQAQHVATHFREKRLYRENLAKVRSLKIKSLNDSFKLEKKDQKWIAQGMLDSELDQNLVRQTIKDLAETTIQNYLFEGDPSDLEKKQKGLFSAPVLIEFESENSHWSAALNLNSEDKALYALTSRPTFLASLDMSRWEKFANLTLDSLRDRKTLMTFSITDVQKFFTKVDGKEYSFSSDNQTWQLNSKLPEKSEFLPIQAEKILNEIHNFEISEFVSPDIAQKFQGHNMIILNSASDQLVFQLNWGPQVKIVKNGIEKEVYLARTQLSKNIFALDKEKIDNLKVDRIFKTIEPSETH